MVTFTGLCLEGSGRADKPNSDRDITAIEFQNRTNTDDVDGRVLECVLRKFVIGIRVVVRGLRSERNEFAFVNEGIELMWPGTSVMSIWPCVLLAAGEDNVRPNSLR